MAAASTFTWTYGAISALQRLLPPMASARAFGHNHKADNRYMAGQVDRGGLGKLYATRVLAPIERQAVIRMNRDTLYASAGCRPCHDHAA